LGITFKKNSIMFSSISSIRKPDRKFNLYHLEGSEVHLSAIKVKLLFGATLDEEVDGCLHLCSRSIFFEPSDAVKPILKVKFSHPLTYRVAEKTDKIKLKYSFITELKNQGLAPSSSSTENKSYFVSFEKMYKGSEKVQQKDQKSSSTNKAERPFNALALIAGKIFFSLRNPIGPYFLERTNTPITFELLRENTTAVINQFLKTLENIMKNKNEDDFPKSIVDSSIVEGIREIEETYKNAINKENFHIYKAQRITPECIVYGAVVLTETEGLFFYPIVNNCYQKRLQLKYPYIKGILRYRYRFKHTAIEIWNYNKNYSILLDFEDNHCREKVFNFLRKHANKRQKSLFDKEYVTENWIKGHISNFDYIMFLNIISNRSFNDLSQYPIFPWIISDFSSQKLDFNDPKIYRDLTKPIGALNRNRLLRFKDGYNDQLKSKYDDTPYLYPSHYSTPGHVLYLLVRKIPEFMLRLQNDIFVPAERYLTSFEAAWDAYVNHGTEVKELTPEFYSLNPDFLINSEKIPLRSSLQGEAVDDVLLPAWAQDASSFLQNMRAGLESDYVSANLNSWIDLMFGYKQKGEEAITNDNLFYPLCYEENIDWLKYSSPYEREAIELQVAQFGQVPIQIFNTPHLRKRTRLIDLHKIPKELHNESNDLLRGRIHATVSEVENLQQEIEKLKYDHTQQVSLQTNNFQNRETQQLKELNKKLNEKDTEIENLQSQINQLNFKYPYGRDTTDYEEILDRVKKDYEDKIERLIAKYEREKDAKGGIIKTNSYEQKEKPVRHHERRFRNDFDGEYNGI